MKSSRNCSLISKRKRTSIFHPEEIDHQFDHHDIWIEQRTSICQFVRSLVYHRNISRKMKEVGWRSKFWVNTCTAHLLVATLEWSKVFGSNTETTHWKKTTPNDRIGEFRDIAFAVSGGDSQWEEIWKHMSTFRSQFVAHTDLSTVMKKVPSFDIPLKISVKYHEWMYRLAQEHGVYFDNNPDIELLYDNIESESEPLIHAAIWDSMNHKEHN